MALLFPFHGPKYPAVAATSFFHDLCGAKLDLACESDNLFLQYLHHHYLQHRATTLVGNVSKPLSNVTCNSSPFPSRALILSG